MSKQSSIPNTLLRERVCNGLVRLGEREYLKREFSLRSADIAIDIFDDATRAEKQKAKVRLREIVEDGQAGLGWRRSLRDLGLPF